VLPTLEFLAALRHRRTEIGDRIIRFHAGYRRQSIHWKRYYAHFVQLELMQVPDSVCNRIAYHLLGFLFLIVAGDFDVYRKNSYTRPRLGQPRQRAEDILVAGGGVVLSWNRLHWTLSGS
jgi:hypothetical protein